MVLALSKELNLFRESVPMVPDAVLLPYWLWSHYYPLPGTSREMLGTMATLVCQIRSHICCCYYIVSASQCNITLWLSLDVKRQGKHIL